MTPEERKARIARAIEREKAEQSAPPAPPEDYTPAARAAGVDVGAFLELKAKVAKRSVRTAMNGTDKAGKVTLEFTNKSTITGEITFNFLNNEAIRLLPTGRDFHITIGLPDNDTSNR